MQIIRVRTVDGLRIVGKCSPGGISNWKGLILLISYLLFSSQYYNFESRCCEYELGLRKAGAEDIWVVPTI